MMNMLKRTFVRMAVAVGMTCGILPSLADTYTDADDHVWTYTVNETSVSVTGVAPCEYDLVIPAEIDGKPVTSFSAAMFKKNEKITSIEIPDSVTSIGDYAFDTCSQLQIVKFGAGIQSIGAWAFSNCPLLQKAELPPATTSIGRGAFNMCLKLTTAKLPGVTVIPGAESDDAHPGWYSGFHYQGAFYGCEKLKTLELGSNLIAIGHGAFYGCKELYDVEIPDSVTGVGNYAFAECNKLYSVSFGKALEQIGCYAFNNDVHLASITFGGTSLHTLWGGAFNGCCDLNNVVLPSGLKEIKSYNFRGCGALESIVIPDSVTNLEIGVFANCTALKTAELGSGLTAISGAEDDGHPGWYSGFHGYGVFYGCTALTNVTISANIKTIHCGAFYGCSELREVTVPNKVTEIRGYAFAECVNLKKAVIGDSVRIVGNDAFLNDIRLETLVLGKKVQTIDVEAFKNCSALKSFEFPDTVMTLGNWAFNNCDSLTEVSLPDSVGVLGVGVFAYCDRLTDMVIGNSVEEISGAEDDGHPGWYSGFHGYGVFYGCTALTNVSFGTSVATIGCGAFYGCSALSEVKLPSCVSSVKAYAFGACSALKTVEMENGGVRSIGNDAFAGDAELENVTFGDRLQTIGENAFKNCRKLKDVVFPDTLQTLNGWCFCGCTSLTNVVIPDEVVTFASGVFAYCTALKSVSIGDSVVVIGGAEDNGHPSWSSGFHGYGAFYGCTALKSVNLGSVTTISCGAFYGCSVLENVVIPDSVITIEPYAFANCPAMRCVTVGTRLTTLGGHAFDGDGALHYLEFKGTAAPTSVGENVYRGTHDRMTTYVADGSTGWTGLYQPGLPETWQGRSIVYAPVPTTAANPYDFYPYTPTGIRIGRTNYDWPSPLMLTKTPYLHGETIPATVAEFKQGETIFLSYAFNEYWRGSMFESMTNTFALSGAKTAQENVARKVSSLDYSYCLGTNRTLNILKDLAPGDYTLTMNLNTGRNLAETDDLNNSTSVTFKVIGRASYTVTFDAHGGAPAPASRTVYEGVEVGELPTVTRAGYAFDGWYTEETDGSRVYSTTEVTANMTCHAHWTKLPNIIFWKPTDDTWTETMFVAGKSNAKSGQAEFTEGDPIYLFYACYEADGRSIATTFENAFLITDAAGTEVESFYQTVRGISSGTCKGAFGDKVEYMQGFKPGTYTLTCTLDVYGDVAEFDEDDNVKTVTFTIKSKEDPGTEDPGTDEPGTDEPGKDEPGKDEPGKDEPGTDEPGKDEPGKDEPGTDEPGKDEPGTSYEPGDNMPVTVIVNNVTVSITVIVGQPWGSNLPAAPTAPEGQVFVGWYTQPGGKGEKVEVSTTVKPTVQMLYAYFIDEKVFELYAEVIGRLDAVSAQVYDGYLRTKDGAVAGTVQIKAAKQKVNKKAQTVTSKLTVAITEVGKKKVTFKGDLDLMTGAIAWSGSKSTPPTLVIGANGLGGFYGAYAIDGGRNVFSAKDAVSKTLAKEIESMWVGAINVVGDDVALAVSIAKKGKVKVSGTVNGAKVTATSQLLVGETACCVPVVITKKATLAFNIWLMDDGTVEIVVGGSWFADRGSWFAAAAGTLKTGAKFAFGDTAAKGLAALPGLLTELLPDGLEVLQNKTKWVVAPDEKGKAAKAGKVMFDKKKGVIDEAKLGENPSALKLTYTAKTGSFKGSFKAYTLLDNKVKAYTFNITGVMVGDKAYGTATLKKPAVSVPILIE